MLDIACIAHHQPPAIVHPRATPLQLPALAGTGAGADRPPASEALPAAGHRGDGGLEASPPQLVAHGLAVIGLIRDQFLGPWARAPAPRGYVDRRQGRHGSGVFRRAGARHLPPDRQPLAVGQDHHLRTLADGGLADARAPRFAGTKRPSRNARDHASLLWASRALRSARQPRSQMPPSGHRCQHRPQVTAAPSSRGRASQAQPVLRTDSMPCKGLRSSARGRPGPRRRSGSHDAITAHCSSGSACLLIPPVSRRQTEFWVVTQFEIGCSCFDYRMPITHPCHTTPTNSEIQTESLPAEPWVCDFCQTWCTIGIDIGANLSPRKGLGMATVSWA